MTQNESLIVEVACVTSTDKMIAIISYLEAEDIQHYCRNQLQNEIFGCYLGASGVSIDILQEDAPRVIELLITGGYEEYITYEKNA